MKRFMLALDFVICLAFASTLVQYESGLFYRALIIMVFFLSVRVLALATHPAVSLINLLMLPLLWRYNPSLLILLYLGYTLLYFYLNRREIFQDQLEKENARLVVETQNLQRYQILQQRYQEQLEENLRLDERRRIAQEIHDLLGHTIAAATLQLEAARLIMNQEPDKAETMVGSSTQLLRDGLDQIRGVVRDMRAQTEGINLSTVEVLVGKVRRDTGLTIHFMKSGNTDRIGTAYWKVVYQIISEALSNIVRHAQANTVRIDIQVMPKLLRLSVADDGQGGETISEGMGLMGIRERIDSLGGTMTIDGRGGFRLNCLMPLEGEDE